MKLLLVAPCLLFKLCCKLLHHHHAVHAVRAQSSAFGLVAAAAQPLRLLSALSLANPEHLLPLQQQQQQQ